MRPTLPTEMQVDLVNVVEKWPTDNLTGDGAAGLVQMLWDTFINHNQVDVLAREIVSYHDAIKEEVRTAYLDSWGR